MWEPGYQGLEFQIKRFGLDSVAKGVDGQGLAVGSGRGVKHSFWAIYQSNNLSLFSSCFHE